MEFETDAGERLFLRYSVTDQFDVTMEAAGSFDAERFGHLLFRFMLGCGFSMEQIAEAFAEEMSVIKGVTAVTLNFSDGTTYTVAAKESTRLQD